jgi:RimJ/RimL family protein N-acetyltransferase
MLSLVRSSIEYVAIEESIINSDSFFNLVSKNKEKLSSEEIAEEVNNAMNIGAERFLLKNNDDFIGLLEYLLVNPNDQSTWLGLLLIKKEFQSQGYGLKALQLFHEIMIMKGIAKYRIGVIAENIPAHKFWYKHGFVRIDSVINNDNKEIIIYEKNLLNA